MADLGTWPLTIAPNSFRLMMKTNQIANESPGGGEEQVIDRLNDRWLCSLTLPPRVKLPPAQVEAFLASFRGQVNWVWLWHWRRPVPLGTLRGAPVVKGAHARGAATLLLQTTAGATLLAGDMLGVSGLLLMVMSDCVADGGGEMAVPLVNRLRKSLANSTPVTWDKPTASFRLLSHSGVSYVPGYTEEVSLELVERVVTA